LESDDIGFLIIFYFYLCVFLQDCGDRGPDEGEREDR
jgi:hypothetical protein